VRIAFFDPFSGASGDMILGALIDAGLCLDDLRADLAKVDLGGYEIVASPVNRNGLSGHQVDVRVEADQPARDWAAIRDLLGRSGLDDEVKQRAIAIFERLANAEAKVHGVPVETVHFHEVGGVDAIVDVCGAVIGLARLGIEHVFAGPLRLGTGTVMTQHGILPVPAPATAELLAIAGAPIAAPHPRMDAVNAELLTPTGAAILTTLAEFTRPAFRPSTIGYCFGSRELPWPNALRVWLGECR
jgi:pyridinium-3,5-bisthiocarboxylic acid mononucleotide nickel chelatase